MGTLIQIGAAVVALALTAGLVLADTRPPRATKTEQPPGRRRRRRLRLARIRRPRLTPRRRPSPPIKPERRARARAAAHDGAIVELAAALRDADPGTIPVPLPTESIGATALEAHPIGEPVLRPDPERLIQHEVAEPSGPAARLSAFLRLITWVGLTGLLLAFTILAVIRGIVLLFENAIS